MSGGGYLWPRDLSNNIVMNTLLIESELLETLTRAAETDPNHWTTFIYDS